YLLGGVLGTPWAQIAGEVEGRHERDPSHLDDGRWHLGSSHHDDPFVPGGRQLPGEATLGRGGLPGHASNQGPGIPSAVAEPAIAPEGEATTPLVRPDKEDTSGSYHEVVDRLLAHLSQRHGPVAPDLKLRQPESH